MKSRKLWLMILSICLCLSMLAGCGDNQSAENSLGKKTLVIGDTTFNSSNEEFDADGIGRIILDAIRILANKEKNCECRSLRKETLLKDVYNSESAKG